MQQARTAGWLTPSWNPERKATESKLQENHEAVAALSPLRGKAESLLRLQRLSSRTMHRASSDSHQSFASFGIVRASPSGSAAGLSRYPLGHRVSTAQQDEGGHAAQHMPEDRAWASSTLLSIR